METKYKLVLVLLPRVWAPGLTTPAFSQWIFQFVRRNLKYGAVLYKITLKHDCKMLQLPTETIFKWIINNEAERLRNIIL